jgi:hypothetical protein
MWWLGLGDGDRMQEIHLAGVVVVPRGHPSIPVMALTSELDEN